MDGHPLDRVIWHSLTGRHAKFSIGDDNARRYHPDIGPLAAVRNESPEAMAALVDLVRQTGPVVLLLLSAPVSIPSTLVIERTAPLVQMTCGRLQAPVIDESLIKPLGADDAPAIRALAAMTEPGPFAARTHELGAFHGILHDGVLAAMAGERMTLPGFSEVSAVCTHPDFRGRGYGAMLTSFGARAILDRGEQVFLHCFEANKTASTLYERLGFAARRTFTMAILREAEEEAGKSC